MANSPLGAVLNLLRTRLEPANADTTDRELLQRFLARQEEGAFGELVRRHGPMILGVCRRVLGDAHAAEDAFQATFLVLVRRARAVPWRESLGGWLHGTARRVALRAKARADRGFDAGRTQTPAAPPDPSEEAAARELRRVLDQELQGLPAKYRAPLVLCDLEGKTHEQAARELGWPRGSVAKRLNGAREQLRARLVRRGVALSAGALASVFTANEVTAAPSAALAAAALLAAEGGASTTATALAKGVIQAMWLTKIKTAAVLMLALAVAGTMAGFGAYRAWEARAAAPAPSTSAPPPTAEDKQMMPIDKAVIYHVGPVQGVQTDQLPEGAVVATDRPESVDDNVHLYLTIFAESKKGKLALPAGPNLAILAVGPVLNSPDEAAVVGLSRHGDKLDLEMAYTSAIAEGKVLKRNVPSRPLVQLPVDLAAGRYRLTVTWQARKALPAGDAWNLPPTVATCDFTVKEADHAEPEKDGGLAVDYVYPGAEQLGSPFNGDGVFAAKYTTLDGLNKVANWYRDKLSKYTGTEGVAVNPANQPGIRTGVVDDSREPGRKDEVGGARPAPVVLIVRKTNEVVVTAAVSRGAGEERTHVALVVVDNKAK